MACPFTGPKFFCARPKIYLHIVVVTNILCQTKRWFAFSKIGFCAGTKVFEEALNAVKFLGWLKKFGPAQNILGPVKGQGINPPNPWLSYFSLNFNGTLGLNNKDSKTNHTWALSSQNLACFLQCFITLFLRKVRSWSVRTGPENFGGPVRSWRTSTC